VETQGLTPERLTEIAEVEARLSKENRRQRRRRGLLVLNLGLFGGFLFGTMHFFRFPVSLFLNMGVAVLLLLSGRETVKRMEEERESLLARLVQLKSDPGRLKEESLGFSVPGSEPHESEGDGIDRS
jgi:hypothetical protein